ncbi:hypothetical protein CC78DRAFT_541836 [Lojkania enalia]|uniref:Uncharacterized protein n=1 Tax=Lojkania enalia TaxID=147567 RepID=A0A9P4N7R7_9PLEO|nr:hypothetical protein CC78DRAFT_541836 [Didymosphaeria enalia]
MHFLTISLVLVTHGNNVESRRFRFNDPETPQNPPLKPFNDPTGPANPVHPSGDNTHSNLLMQNGISKNMNVLEETLEGIWIVTPTTTLPVTSFAACTSYASTLSRCATDTTSFFSLDPTAQASCACYETITPSSCTRDETTTVFPTLARTGFDNAASACFDYFRIQGYENVAKALSGTTGNKTVLGAGFCKNIDLDLKKKSNFSTAVGLAPTGASQAHHICASLLDFDNPTGGSRGLTLRAFDRAVFFTAPVIAIEVSYLLFS